MSYPDWLNSNPIVDEETSTKSYQTMNELAHEHNEDLHSLLPYDWFLNIIPSIYGCNTIHVNDKIGFSGYPDSFTHEDVTQSVMWGKIKDDQLFIIIKFDIDGELIMTTFFEKRPNVWIPCGKQTPFFNFDGCCQNDHFELIVNVITGRSIVPSDRQNVSAKYSGKTIKLWK